MPNPFAGLATRTIAMIVAACVLVAVGAFVVHSWDKRRSEAAQSRVQHSQSEALSNSGADAVNTVAASVKAAAASEELTRSNEQQIRAAQGANDKVNPAVRDAGIAALCRRQAYANDPRCHRP
jgi:negative regulator of sigma E activity